MIDYDPHDWSSHLFAIRGSMLRDLFVRVLMVTLWAAGVAAFDGWVQPLKMPALGHSLIGVALGLVLVVRTNSAYDRFWEARRQWGTIINASRNLVRTASVWLEPARVRTLAGWTAAFARACLNRLRGLPGVEVPAEVLPEADRLAVAAAGHVPLAVSRRMSAVLAEAGAEGKLTEFRLVAMDACVGSLIDCIGACERIRNTPLPFAYVVHLRRCLILYCVTLPFGVIELYGWGTVPLTAVIAFTLLGIEEIGVEIEEPFGTDDNDLPLERFCDTVRNDAMETAASVAGDPLRR